MSWFDATGIASLAKSALKEAQKTIDKALDIKGDEDVNDSNAETNSSSTSDLSIKSDSASKETSESVSENLKMMKQSISNPILSTMSTMPSATSASNLWGSFTGSFFDPNNVNDGSAKTVTKPPTGNASGTTSDISGLQKEDKGGMEPVGNRRGTVGDLSGRTSSASASASASGSVELLSSPLTPPSNLTSPSTNQTQSSASCITIQHSQTPSESIEVINTANASETSALSSDINSPDSVISTAPILTSASCTSISDSVEVIDSSHVTSKPSASKNSVMSSSIEEMQNIENDEEDDSISYNTVSESLATITIMDSASTVTPAISPKAPITTPPSRTGLVLPIATPAVTLLSVPSKSKQTEHDAQTQLSDSTQSFEDVQQILLDEANRQNKKLTRESATTPPSSDDKSDLVKIPSTSCGGVLDLHSGHTSADEIETATSSDIEIISGPNGNGDSSSTNSIAGLVYKSSPKIAGMAYHGSHSSQMGAHSQYVVCGSAGTKKKGHYRESSGTSTYSMHSESGSDGCLHTSAEVEKLMQQIAELSEVLESRESKLVELGRENAELREKYAEQKLQLDTMKGRADKQEVNNIAEEYTQRMSALEKKFQQTLRERDNLRNELKSIQSSLSKSVSRDDIDKIVKEKDCMIEELKREGEKLSKQILQHSNIIKKLRAKEKETDAQIKRQLEQIDELTLETDRLKKSLSAKDEMELNQMGAVSKLSAEKGKLAKELAQAKSELDDTVQKLKTLQTSFDIAKKELHEKQQEHSSLSRKANDLKNLQSEQEMMLQQNQQMAQELDTLRKKLKLTAVEHSEQQQKLRQENAGLIRRLEEIEQRSEEQAHAITEATIPLVRQCEALQKTLNTRTASWEKQEQTLLQKIDLLEKQLVNVSAVEQTANEQSDQLNSRITHLEEQLSKALLRSEQSATALQQKQVELDLLEAEQRKLQDEIEQNAVEHTKTCQRLKMEISDLQSRVDSYVAAGNSRLVEQQSGDGKNNRSVDISNSSNVFDDESRLNRSEDNSSPTLSVGRMSAADSLASNVWPLEDIDSISNAGGRPSIGGSSSFYGPGSFTISGSTMIETLQSSLKQRDGENHQLQWEMSRLQSERNFLMSEVSSLTSQLDNIKEKLATHDTIVNQYTELQEQYDAILQMYGEKVEETQELQLDLQDVKDMYRAQIDDLLVQQRQSQQQLSNLQQEKRKNEDK